MIKQEEQRGGGLSYEKVEGKEERGRGIKKIVSVWLMVLCGSLMSSDGQNDWQSV